MVQSSDARPRRSGLYPASVDLGHRSEDALRGGRAFLAEGLSWEAEAEFGGLGRSGVQWDILCLASLSKAHLEYHWFLLEFSKVSHLE